ncbi:adenylate/guanylate cyclase domain-containing protein [Roseomonas eburnea]|uniref:Adenylate/guanylate cyclase domain-containing protein n=1 Tax=Neoroseomonas eburnea TaxID=1346889 RepID=A0A9X9X5D0_9PROT|nr:adenylate/guanylate cyclase domain-containing protein [Neoroseomonas eburnea]MBR0678916.1 adenylate/guanylate cyclase domain-containing protein [Neoroseomonas eburnea]
MRLRPHLNFTVTILTAFSLVFVAAVAMVVVGFRDAGSRAAQETAERHLAAAAAATAASTRGLIHPLLGHAAVLARMPAEAGAALEPALGALIAETPVLAVSVVLPDGALHQVLRLAALPEGAAPAPRPTGAVFAMRRVPAEAATPESWTFLDAQGGPRGRALAPRGAGDARGLSWVLQAREPGVHVSTLYDLPLLGRPGLTVSHGLAGGGAVGLDLALADLGGFLAAHKVSPNAITVLFTEDGILLGHQDPQHAVQPASQGGRTSWTTLAASGDPAMRALWSAYAEARLAPGGMHMLPIGGVDHMVHLAAVEDFVAPRVLAGVLAPLSDFTAGIDRGIRNGTLLALGALAMGLVGLGVVSWRVAHPLGMLAREAEAIRRLDLAQPLQLQSRITEVERLAEAMGGMKAALRLFSVYVPRDLVRKLMAEGAEAELGGERRRLTVMFSDVQGFTSIAERMDPEELMRVTSSYFQELTDDLLEQHATIDKYIGDAVMAIWNAPKRDLAHALHGCRAALRARLLTQRLEEEFAARGWPRLHTRFGLHTGEAVVGNVGSSDRMAYTAIGSMVNLASRLEGMNKMYGTQILVSEQTRLGAGSGFVFRPVDLVLAKGTQDPVEVHELVGLSVAADPKDAPLLADPALVARLPAWGEAIRRWRAGQFDAAAAALREAGDPAKDPLVAAYAARLARYPGGRPDDWSPVTRLDSK